MYCMQGESCRRRRCHPVALFTRVVRSPASAFQYRRLFVLRVLTFGLVMKIALYPGSKSMDPVLYVVTRSTPTPHPPPIPLPTTTLPPRETARVRAAAISEQRHRHGYRISLEVGAIRGVEMVVHRRNLGNGLDKILSLLRRRIWTRVSRGFFELGVDMVAGGASCRLGLLPRRLVVLLRGEHKGDTLTIYLSFRFAWESDGANYPYWLLVFPCPRILISTSPLFLPFYFRLLLRKRWIGLVTVYTFSALP